VVWLHYLSECGLDLPTPPWQSNVIDGADQSKVPSTQIYWYSTFIVRAIYITAPAEPEIKLGVACAGFDMWLRLLTECSCVVFVLELVGFCEWAVDWVSVLCKGKTQWTDCIELLIRFFIKWCEIPWFIWLIPISGNNNASCALLAMIHFHVFVQYRQQVKV
jgi:hypothetical protein